MPGTDPDRKRPDQNRGEFVVRSDQPVKTGDTPPLYITKPGHAVRQGYYTPVLAIARRWTTRPAAWRWLKRRQAPAMNPPELAACWYLHNLAPPRPRPRRPQTTPH